MRQWIAVALALTAALAASATEVPVGVTMVLLERDTCYGTCPAYSVRVTKDGAVRFEGRNWVEEFGLREWEVSQSDFHHLVDAVETAKFDDLPNDFPPDVCEEFGTCAPTLWITVMKDATLKRVAYYFGCKGGTFKNEIARIVELGERIDEIAGTSQWIGPEDRRRATRCVQQEPYVVSLEGIVVYRTFADANRKPERHSLLLLDDPVCVEDANDGLNVSEQNQTLIQLSGNLEQFGGEPVLSGERVVAAGALFHGHTAHHHAALLLNVQDLEIKDSNKPLQPTRAAGPPYNVSRRVSARAAERQR